MKVTKDMKVSVTFTKLVNVTLMTGNVSLRTISSAAGKSLKSRLIWSKQGTYLPAGIRNRSCLINGILTMIFFK